MSSQHVQRGTTTLSDGSSAPVYEAQFVTGREHNYERWWRCVVCGFEYPESEVSVINGAAYCHKFKHNHPAEVKGEGGVKWHSK
jgi:hypothetical protein